MSNSPLPVVAQRFEFDKSALRVEARPRFENFKRRWKWPVILRRELYESGDSTGAHRHMDFLALYTVRGGRGLHTIEGQTYALALGDVYLMAPGMTHAYHEFRALQMDALYFQSTLFSVEESAILRAMPMFWQLFVPHAGSSSSETSLHHHLRLESEVRARFDLRLDELHAHWNAPTPAGPLLFRAAVFEMLVALARQLETKQQTPRAGDACERAALSRSSISITDILLFCRENYRHPITVESLASRFFVSPGHLSELFVRETGLPPAAFIRRLRLERACALLAQKQLPVAEIATRVGFGSSAHFCRTFRATYGVSPLQHRAQILKAD
ncbi:MAG TPA: AraC family transcriptional regulator [Abditibacterium sp.]|jgi:AraC-like DNA-binding protein